MNSTTRIVLAAGRSVHTVGFVKVSVPTWTTGALSRSAVRMDANMIRPELGGLYRKVFPRYLRHTPFHHHRKPKRLLVVLSVLTHERSSYEDVQPIRHSVCRGSGADDACAGTGATGRPSNCAGAVRVCRR